ncbi:MAG: phosphotransferase [Anaerolineales bacterium]
MIRHPLRSAALTLLAVMWLTACAPAATQAPTQPAASQATSAPAPTQASEPTQAPAAETGAVQPTALPTIVLPTPATLVEARVVDVEWPTRMRLGDSESVRVTLIPYTTGYIVTTEIEDNTTLTQTVNVARPAGYELFGVARLEGVGFEIAPVVEQANALPAGESVTWRWTLTAREPGQHRLTLNLLLRWVGPQPREAQLFSKTLTVEVMSFLGLSTRMTMWLGVLGLMLGGGMSVAALTYRARPRERAREHAPQPNPSLTLEPPPGLTLSATERTLLQTLFRRYGRLVIESEFRSGYSGARALLALPVQTDGRADAHTIVKIGERRAIEREHANYEKFVKDTLPPMTARIQDAPVTAHSTLHAPPSSALRYTFISEPGQRPISLREALHSIPDPALLAKLFDTFGPNWWMQRKPFTFRVAQEYDRLLPAHLVLEPLPSKAYRVTHAPVVTAQTSPAQVDWSLDQFVWVERFADIEPRQDGKSFSLIGATQPGQPPLRVRWLGARAPEMQRTPARIISTRETLLREFVAGMDLYGLPDPLLKLNDALNETIVGSQSTIHGDLNLENVLVGPGGFVWLIDFAQTRDGHPLFDFAHLEAEIIAHNLAPQFKPPVEYISMWRGASLHPLLSTLHKIAARCLANPTQPREYDLALFMACLGALKYPNLTPHAKHLLYLTAAHLGQRI